MLIGEQRKTCKKIKFPKKAKRIREMCVQASDKLKLEEDEEERAKIISKD